MGRLEGKVALVTGGAGGAGRDDVLLLAREGARVVISDIDADAGMALAREIGAQAQFLRHDVASDAGWRSVFEALQRRFDRLDILVNNAAIALPVAIDAASARERQAAGQVNADSCLLGCRYGVAAMKQAGGSIINMAWAGSWLPIATHAAYRSAKSAVGALTRTTARHCRAQGFAVRLNSIHPGTLHHPMRLAAGPGSDPDQLLFDGARYRGAGAGVPDQVAGIVLFLASDESRLISGTRIRVDHAIAGAGL